MHKRLLSISISLLLSVVILAFPSNQLLFALTEQERSSLNLDTVWYVPLNGRPCAIATAISLSGSDNVEIAFNFLVSKGLTANQAAGFVGNLIAESGVNPRKVEIKYSDPPHLSDTVPPDLIAPGVPNGVPGYGLAQWTGGRKDTLKAFATSSGKADSDLGMQLDYLWSELEGSYYGRLVLTPLKATNTLEQATDLVLRKFEAPKVPNLAPRIANAQAVLTQVGGGGAAVSASTASMACPGAIGNGQDTKYVDGFTIYSQYDPSWKDLPYSTSTIGASGCGPSAMAMIITNLGTRVTPVETANFASSKNLYIAGAGSSWGIAPTLAEHWGLKSEAIGANISKIAQTLQAGGLVITAGKGTSPFTQAGHFIVIRGVTADGKFKVGDSNDPSSNTKDWDPQLLLSNMAGFEGSVYAITK